MKVTFFFCYPGEDKPNSVSDEMDIIPRTSEVVMIPVPGSEQDATYVVERVVWRPGFNGLTDSIAPAIFLELKRDQDKPVAPDNVRRRGK